MATDPVRSIGQVLTVMKGDFPDISISKIRFLESEGLLSPQRAPSGYRRYSPEDVERLRYILSVQKNQYLPLKVIREHLDMMDRGLEPPTSDPSRPTVPEAPPPAAVTNHTTQQSPQQPGQQRPNRSLAPKPKLRLSRKDLLEHSGLTEPALVELEKQNIVSTRRGTTHYGREALTLAIAARKLAHFGLDARHLRAFKIAADREVGVVEAAIAPYLRRRQGNPEAVAEVLHLVISAHAALVRSAMDR